MKKIIATLVYVVAQIYLLPLAVAGFVLVLYKQMFVSWRLGVSSTAVEVINGRWMMAIFGLRPDAASVKLNHVLPNSSVTGLWLVFNPLYLRYRISGEHWGYPTLAERGKETTGHLIINRAVYFDEIIRKHQAEAEQFVVMGAGYDTRCYGPLQDSNLTFFELDQPKTQRLKRKYLDRAGIDASHVRFVEVDFATQQWYEELEKVGYDPTQRTIFLWEGVTLYLTEEAVRSTLREIKAHTGSGSVLACDLYAHRFVQGSSSRTKYLKPLLKLTNEAFSFGLDFSASYEATLRAFLESEDINVGDTYFMGSNAENGPYALVVEALL